MTQELPPDIEPTVHAILKEHCRLHDAPLGVDALHLTLNHTRPGTTLAAVQRVLHRFTLEGLVEQDDRTHFHLSLGAVADDGAEEQEI